jgi:hypothetical protein
MKINIDGKSFKVVENLGYQGGYRAKAVDTLDGEKIVVYRNGRWEWWTAKDRLNISEEGKS